MAPSVKGDWYHRDCPADFCYWMMPDCHEMRERVTAIDPERTKTRAEIEAQLYPVQPTDFVKYGSLFVMSADIPRKE